MAKTQFLPGFSIVTILLSLLISYESLLETNLSPTLVCLAYYGGLRHTELMGLRVEMCEISPEDVFLTHMRSKQRSDKRNSKFLVPRTQQKFTTKLYNGFLMLKGFQVRLDNCLKNKHQQNKLYFLNVKKLYVPIYRWSRVAVP